MKNVFQIDQYRHRARRDYLRRHRQQLDRFISGFVDQHLGFDYRQFAEQYLTFQSLNDESAWDFQDMREHLKDLLVESCSAMLAEELKDQRWYQSKYLSIDDLAERCVTYLILGKDKAAL